ncbi:MAG: DUF4363 family protein [Oscillospiraceae bacterium]
MKRLVLCVCILAVILAQSICGVVLLRHCNTEVQCAVEQAVSDARSGDREQTLCALDEVSTEWRQYYKRVNFLIQTSKLEQIAISVSRLHALYEADCAEFYAECDVVLNALDAIYENEFPHIYSII